MYTKFVYNATDFVYLLFLYTVYPEGVRMYLEEFQRPAYRDLQHQLTMSINVVNGTYNCHGRYTF